MRAHVMVLLAVAAPHLARADAGHDVAAGVRHYESFEPEQAVKALRSALASGLSEPSSRARAHLYLGFSLAALGASDADAELEAAFIDQPDLPLPADTPTPLARRAEAARTVAKARTLQAQVKAELAPEPPPPTQASEGSWSPPPVLTAPPPPPPSAPAEPPSLKGPPSASVPGPTPSAPRAASSDSGRELGVGFRLLYVPADRTIGPAVEASLGRGRAAAVLTIYPGTAWALGAAARLSFGPQIRFLRFEFGFDAGLLLFPSRLLLGYEANAHLLAASFALGPVRLVARLLTLGLYGSLTTAPLVFRGAVTSGIGVLY